MNETELDNLKEIFKELEDQPTYTFELVNIDRYELVERKSWKRLEALNKIKEKYENSEDPTAYKFKAYNQVMRNLINYGRNDEVS